MASVHQTVEPHTETLKARKQLRRKEYKLLHRIQEKVERRYKTPVLDDKQLPDIGVCRGAPFDIDSDDVLDFDSRYFLAGSIADIDRGMLLARQNRSDHSNIHWACGEPIQFHLLRGAQSGLLEGEAQDISYDAKLHDMFCYENTRNILGWTPHQFMPIDKIPYFRRSWVSPSDGKIDAHVFHTGRCFMWPAGPGPQQWEYHPGVPHAVATVWESRVPRTGGLLRSELLVAIRLIKTQISDISVFLDHRICPVLIMSFHGRFSARLLQAHMENGRLIVRPSRLLNLHVKAISPDVHLALRWMNSRPIGDTRFPTKGDELTGNEDNVEGITTAPLRIYHEQAV